MEREGDGRLGTQCFALMYIRAKPLSCIFQTQTISNLVMQEVLPPIFVALRILSNLVGFSGRVAIVVFPSEHVEQNNVYAETNEVHSLCSLLVFYENFSLNGEGDDVILP